MIGRRLRIHGRVQGVFFRNWTVEQAETRGVRGWVRNRGDGSVEVLVFGEPEAVEGLIACSGEGPPAARVERVEVEEASGEAPEGFRKAPSA